jgi:hypothetical protein
MSEHTININKIYIKEKIENMNKHHQIEILRLLKKDKNIVLNENSNGVFVNISYLDDNTLESLKKYIEYVDNQTVNIESVENKKTIIETTYFKGNKD